MRFLSYGECGEWCSRHGYPVRQDAHGRPTPFLSDTFDWLAVTYPADSGKKVHLARRVLKESDLTRGALLWIVEWSVWPSSEHMPLFAQLRRAMGETRTLIDAPAHLISQEESDEAMSVLAVSILFVWDCYVLPAAFGPAFFCSHDEFAGFHIPAGYDQSRLSREFS